MIIPVILEKEIAEAQRKIELIQNEADIIQIDIADGLLVSGKTFTGLKSLSQLRSKKPLEVHLMVKEPLTYLTEKISNVVRIITQVEVEPYVMEFLTKAKKFGYETGISINPETPLDNLESFIELSDVVQFMTVKPGTQGHELFIPKVLDKIILFRTKYPNKVIQCDGGIKEQHLSTMLQVGVNNVVIGSEIFGSEKPGERYLELKNLFNMDNKIASIIDINAQKKVHKIAFLGGASWNESEQPYKDAFEVAKLLAENGYEIVNGGGPGVMRASTEGAHAAGKRALAITYHPNKPKRHYEGTDPNNKFDEEIITLDYFDRTKVMLQNTDLHIVFKGSIGTLSEFGMTWISSWIHEPNSKPIILFGDFWDSILDVIENNMLIKLGEREMLKVCTKYEEVLEYVKNMENGKMEEEPIVQSNTAFANWIR